MIIYGRDGLGTHRSKAVSYVYVCECGMCEHYVYSACVIECVWVCVYVCTLYICEYVCVSHMYAVHI